MSALLIIGLRRSGTTAFWKWFRNDPRLICFDEPFSEQLLRLPSEHPKQIWSEYQALCGADPRQFWARYAPIHRTDELRPGLHEDQADYLQWLAAQSEHTVFDLTRCHLKLEVLRAALPNARVIHLTRTRPAFTSSHLLPSRTDAVGRVRSRLRERSFWTRTSGYDFWGMESLAGTAPTSQFGLGLTDMGGDAEAFYRAPATVRLGVMWRWFGRHVTQNGPKLFDDHYASVEFEAFTRNPAASIAEVCRRIDFPLPDSRAGTTIRPASPGHRPDDPRWRAVGAEIDEILPPESTEP